MSATIVHVTTVHSPFDTRIFWKECRSLARDGYDVTLVAPGVPDGERDGVHVRGIPAPSSRLERLTSTGRAAVRRTLGLNPDLVHLHDPELLLWAPVLKRGGRVVVFDMHENLPAAILTKAWVSSSLRRALSISWAGAERLLLRGLPVVFAEQSYPRAYPFVRESEIVQNLPDIDALVTVEAEKATAPTLGYMGTITMERGCKAMIDAVASVRRNGIPARLELIGPVADAASSALLTAVTAGPDGGSVRVHGRLPPDQGWQIIARCHVGLALLSPTPNYIESYPTKLFEYMALGVPVVTSAFPLYREIVETERCGICVDPDSPDEIYQALKWLLEHPDEAAEMGDRGRRAVMQRYTWSAEFDRLSGFYKRLLASLA